MSLLATLSAFTYIDIKNIKKPDFFFFFHSANCIVSLLRSAVNCLFTGAGDCNPQRALKGECVSANKRRSDLEFRPTVAGLRPGGAHRYHSASCA